MRSIPDQSYQARGFILTEACVSMTLIGLVLGVASLLLTEHARTTEYFLNYRRAQLAAESSVELMRIGALDVVNADFTDDAGIKYRIRVTDADGDWRPLRGLEVVAVVGETKSSIAKYSLHAYLAPDTLSGGRGP